MTVSAQTPLNRSTGNGVTTVFPYTFKILAQGDIEVTVAGVVQTLTTNYTVSGVGVEGGGNVTMLIPPANGATVVRRRTMALIRTVDFQDQGELPTNTLDDDQDAPILMIQQLDEELGRALTVSPEASGVNLQLPAPTALTYLRWNALANAIENVLLTNVSLITLTTYAQTLLNAADAAVARGVLGAAALGNNTSTVYATAGTATAYTIVPNPAITAYAAGQSHRVSFGLASGTAPTLQINGIATPPNLVTQQANGTYANVVGIPAGHSSEVRLLSATQALVVTMPPSAAAGGLTRGQVSAIAADLFL